MRITSLTSTAEGRQSNKQGESRLIDFVDEADQPKRVD